MPKTQVKNQDSSKFQESRFIQTRLKNQEDLSEDSREDSRLQEPQEKHQDKYKKNFSKKNLLPEFLLSGNQLP